MSFALNGDKPSRAPRVLIIEDDTLSAETLETLLELDGYDVRTAFNGADGLAVASQFDPDVVLLDLQLPVVNGVEVALHLRANAQEDGLVIIGTTGYPDSYPTTRGAFNRRFVKPIHIDSLLACLREACDARLGLGTPA